MAGVLFLTSEEVIRNHIPTYEVAFQVLKGTDVRVNEFRRRPIVEEYEAVVQQFKAYIEETDICINYGEVKRGRVGQTVEKLLGCGRKNLTMRFKRKCV